MRFGLVTYHGADGDRVGVLLDERVYDAAPALEPLLGERVTMLDLLDRWQESYPLLREYAEAAERTARSQAVHSPQLRAPLPRPRTIFCAFANYADHMQEMGGQPADTALEDPYLFLVPPAAVTAPEEPILLPRGFASVDWEAELAAIIGRPARNVTVEQALSCVAGYTILNDVSARRGARRGANAGRPDFLSSKGRESFKPMGPALIPAEFVPDPQALSVRLWVSGTLQQDSSTAQMIFSTAEQISFASRVVTLQPGDVFATGTPAGVGMPRNLFLKPGDDVTIEIEGLGRLHNPVREG